MSITSRAIQDLLDELEASRASGKRAWENLQEIRWILKEATGIDLPAGPSPRGWGEPWIINRLQRDVPCFFGN